MLVLPSCVVSLCLLGSSFLLLMVARLQGELIIGCGFALIPYGDVMSLLLG
jgi:hypothetical protein